MSTLETLAELFATGGIELRRGPLFDEAPSPLPTHVPLRDRVEGMLLGLAVGDALGNTSEGLLPGERRARYGEICDYLPDRYAEGRRVGLPSDNTQLAFVRLLGDLLGRDTPPAPEWWLDRYLETARELELDRPYAPRGGAYPDFRGPLWRYVEEVVPPAWAEGLSVRDAGRRWYSGAYLLETVPSVLYVLMRHGEDPEEAIVRAVNDTKDNDTVAAIVGAAAGALHGRSRLPGRWVENLLGRTRAHDDGEAFRLLDAACARWVPATREGMSVPPVPRSHP